MKNRLWGAERIRGELLKLGRPVCKRTTQKYLRRVRTQEPSGQKWSPFLHKHAAALWSCDFLQVTDLFFRPLFAFFLSELKSRRVIHVGLTRSPTDPWVAEPLREATPDGQAPQYLMCDHDSKFGPCFAIKGSGNSFQKRLVDLFQQSMTAGKSSPSRSWVDYTTTSEE